LCIIGARLGKTTQDEERPMPSVLAVGDINVDVIALISHYPQKGGDGLAEKGELHAGGSAANTALTLARFGVEVGLLGRVGADPLADYVLGELRRSGVELDLVQRDQEALTGIMFIVVTPDGERTMFGCRGANSHLAPISLNELNGLRWLHVSGYALLEEPQRTTALMALETAHRRGMTISLDVGMCTAIRAKEDVRKLLPKVDVLFPNLEEARLLTEKERAREALEALLEGGAGLVALKLGKEGCMVGDGKSVFKVPAFPVEVVDTTGAGDGFNAGFILGRLWGLSLRESALLGNALGGLACTVLGAGERLPGPREAQELLQQAIASPKWEEWNDELKHLSRILMRRKGK